MQIKNSKLRKMMDAAGYEKFGLWRGEGYFYVYSDDPECNAMLNCLYSTSIYCCYFNQMSIEDWFEEISHIIETAKAAYAEGSYGVNV